MRKWSKIILIIVAVVVVASITVSFITYCPRFSSGGVQQIEMITLPSPPKEKTVTQKEDIIALLNYINKTAKHPKLYFGLSGWQMYIKFNQSNVEHRITLSGNIMNVDGRWYTVDKNVLPTLEKRYKEFEYSEINYIDGGSK